MDGDSNYVVADTYNHRVQLCSASDFRDCTTVAATGTSQLLNIPRCVAVDASGDCIIADSDNHRVLRCPSSSSGSACEVMVSGLNYPTHVSILPTAEYLIISHHEVLRCPASAGATCTTVAGLGGYGTGSTQLSYPWSSAVDDNGDYLIADRANHRIQLCPAATPGTD